MDARQSRAAEHLERKPAVGPSTERQFSSALYRWATGLGESTDGRVVLASGRTGLDELRQRGGEHDIYLCQSSGDAARTDIANRLFFFEGEFERPGDVIHIGSGYEVELKDYLAVPFTPITRPAVVQCTTAAAWGALIEDADEARATGAFISQLTSQATILADQSVIEAVIESTPVEINRLSVTGAGGVRYRPGGPIVGSCASADLGSQPASAFLIGEEDDSGAAAALVSAMASRPWIRRYLTALRVLGAPDGAGWSIEGFGSDPLVEETDDSSRRGLAHLIARRGDDYRLISESGRRFDLARDTAVAVESLLTSLSWERATAAARAAGLRPVGLERELADLNRRLVAAGVPTGLNAPESP